MVDLLSDGKAKTKKVYDSTHSDPKVQIVLSFLVFPLTHDSFRVDIVRTPSIHLLSITRQKCMYELLRFMC